MNALTGNQALLPIFCSIDMNALTGTAQNHTARSMADSSGQPAGKPHISIQGYGNRRPVCRGHLILYV
jgi:hypothetical protein